MSLVVVGTDTEVGKTVVSAILLARYGRRVQLGYWKPIASGATEGSDTDDLRRWCGHLADVLPPRYVFDAPLSPHVAARLEHRRVTPDAVLESLVEYAVTEPERSLIIEGIGGVLVPLTDDGYLLSHLVAELHLPCLVVARSTLGTINHTLLTLEALRQRGIEIAGVVLNGPRNRENRRAIEGFGDVDVVAEVEQLPRLGRAAIAKAAKRFDRRARLKPFLV